MSDIFVAEAVLRIINDHRRTVQDVLQYNNVKNMEHYRELMGNLDALNYVEQELKSLLNKQEQNDVSEKERHKSLRPVVSSNNLIPCD